MQGLPGPLGMRATRRPLRRRHGGCPYTPPPSPRSHTALSLFTFSLTFHPSSGQYLRRFYNFPSELTLSPYESLVRSTKPDRLEASNGNRISAPHHVESLKSQSVVEAGGARG
mmetsp:Transcript_28606/g.24039  ORF Transcript_28606/g.24039 Transcript_28606/m.24039 type:complete len:113 (+) Transcript_28606:183-521(+)